MARTNFAFRAKLKRFRRTVTSPWVPIVISVCALATSVFSAYLVYKTYSKGGEQLVIRPFGDTEVSATRIGLAFQTKFHISNLSTNSSIVTGFTCFSGGGHICDLQDGQGKSPNANVPLKLEPGQSKVIALRLVKFPGTRAMPFYKGMVMTLKPDASYDMGWDEFAKLMSENVVTDRKSVHGIIGFLAKQGMDYSGDPLIDGESENVAKRMVTISNFICPEGKPPKVTVCIEILVHTAAGNEFKYGKALFGALFGSEASALEIGNR